MLPTDGVGLSGVFQGTLLFLSSCQIHKGLVGSYVSLSPLRRLPERNILKEGRFILVHGFKSFSPAFLSPLFWACGACRTFHQGGRLQWSKASWQRSTDRQADKDSPAQDVAPKEVPPNLFPLARLHLPKYPSPSLIAP